MPHFMLRWCFKDKAVRAMTDRPQDREAAARVVVEAFGGHLFCYYFMLGDYDGMLIASFPDSESAAACGMRVTAGGAVGRLETHELLTAQEAQHAMQRAKSAGDVYRSPLA